MKHLIGDILLLTSAFVFGVGCTVKIYGIYFKTRKEVKK